MHLWNLSTRESISILGWTILVVNRLICATKLSHAKACPCCAWGLQGTKEDRASWPLVREREREIIRFGRFVASSEGKISLHVHQTREEVPSVASAFNKGWKFSVFLSYWIILSLMVSSSSQVVFPRCIYLFEANRPYLNFTFKNLML